MANCLYNGNNYTRLICENIICKSDVQFTVENKIAVTLYGHQLVSIFEIENDFEYLPLIHDKSSPKESKLVKCNNVIISRVIDGLNLLFDGYLYVDEKKLSENDINFLKDIQTKIENAAPGNTAILRQTELDQMAKLYDKLKK